MAIGRHSPRRSSSRAWIRKLALTGALLGALPGALPVSAGPLHDSGAGPGAADGLDALTRAVAEVDELVADAHFRTALAVAEKTRTWARDIPSSPEVREVRAQLDVLLATTQVALGRPRAARASLARAVQVWPLLSLDERTTSPRVVSLFRELRASAVAERHSR